MKRILPFALSILLLASCGKAPSGSTPTDDGKPASSGNSSNPSVPAGPVGGNNIQRALNLIAQRNYHLDYVIDMDSMGMGMMDFSLDVDGTIALLDETMYMDISHYNEGYEIMYSLQDDGTYKTTRYEIPERGDTSPDFMIVNPFTYEEFEEGFDGWYMKEHYLAAHHMEECTISTNADVSEVEVDYILKITMEEEDVYMEATFECSCTFTKFGQIHLSLPNV